MSNMEEMLSAIVEGETITAEPQCRTEQFLKALANGEGTENLPEPNCRVEEYYKRMVEKGMDRPDQTKTVTPTTSQQIVTPDSGWELGSVVVEAAPLQEKSVKPAEEQQTITADSPHIGLSAVTIEAAPLQEKTVIPTEEQQIITADSPYVGLSKVTVEPMEVVKNSVDSLMSGRYGGITDEQATAILNGTYVIEEVS